MKVRVEYNDVGKALYHAKQIILQEVRQVEVNPLTFSVLEGDKLCRGATHTIKRIHITIK